MDTKLIDTVRELAEPIVQDQGLELVDVQYLQERGRWVVRITIDKEHGVTLDDCTTLSREIGALLEVHDILPHAYHLEVSSPGLERPLKTQKDFKKFLGRSIAIKTSELLEGKRNFKGTLKQVSPDAVTVEMEGKPWKIPFHVIRQAKLAYEFPEKGLLR